MVGQRISVAPVFPAVGGGAFEPDQGSPSSSYESSIYKLIFIRRGGVKIVDKGTDRGIKSVTES
jgi:hypothetical protein